MKRLFLIRHGATPGNLKNRYIGVTDEPLSGEGIRQCEKLAELISREREFPEILFVSPMKRALQTAEIVFPTLPKQILPDLREMNFGDFEGRNADEMAEDAAYRRWVDSGCEDPVPGGESRRTFKERCIRAFKNAVDAPETGNSAAFVTHGGCIMAILEAFAVPARNWYSYFVPNAFAVTCEYDNGIIRIR